MAVHQHPSEKPHPNPAFYVAVGAVLAFVTGIEVAAFYLDVSGSVLIPIFIILSLLKFVLVVLFYMHLRYDHRLFGSFFAGGLMLAMGVMLGLISLFGTFVLAPPPLSITDNDYGQSRQDFSVLAGTTLTNKVTWTATGLQGRGGFVFLRFDTEPTVELLPADLTVTFAGTPVPAIQVGFNALEYQVADIPDLETGGNISYSVTFNTALRLNNSRVEITALGETSESSNSLSHQITVEPRLCNPCITDDDYGQPRQDFSVLVGTTLTNTVTWTATGFQGRGGFVFLRFDTEPTVELLPADLTVSFAGTPVPAIQVGFNALEYQVADISDLGTGGNISYSVMFNTELQLNDSRVEITAFGEPLESSNSLSHQITVGELGPVVFIAKGCGACHTIEELKDKEATGTIGPPLDGIATRGVTRPTGYTAEEYMRESIEDPGAFLVEGCANLMLPLRGTMTDEEFEALIAFLLTLDEGPLEASC